MDENENAVCCPCPLCGEDDADRLVWQEDGETVRCSMCGTDYQP